MKKLFNLKEWLTTYDAAKHLSILFDEDVSEADVLRLALDGHLTLSVNFVNHATGKIGKIIPMKEAKMYIMPKNLNNVKPGESIKEVLFNEVDNLPDEIKSGLEDHSLFLMPMGDAINDNEVIQYTNEITSISGIWDLPMIGSERLDVEHLYQQLTSGPEVTLTCLGGTLVTSPNGEIANIQESFDKNEYHQGSLAQLEKLKKFIDENNIDAEKSKSLLEQHKKDRKKFLDKKKQKPATENYYPAGGLPDDAVLVVRTEALRKLEDTLSEKPAQQDKPLRPNERNSLLTIISALCNKAGIDLEKRGISIEIAKLTEEMGTPVSDDTVRRVLEKIPDAVESRMK